MNARTYMCVCLPKQKPLDWYSLNSRLDQE